MGLSLSQIYGDPHLLGLFINAGGTIGCVTKVALRLKTWPKMKHMAYYWKSGEIDKVTQAHYDLQRYAEIFSIELLNHNTALSLRGIDTQPPIEIPDDVGFLMLIIQDGLTDEELEVRTKIAKEILAKNSGRDLGDIWERLAGPPKYWWYTMYCDTLYGGGLKPAAGEKVSIGLNSACTMIYCPTKMFPKVYKLGYDMYVKSINSPKSITCGTVGQTGTPWIHILCSSLMVPMLRR